MINHNVFFGNVFPSIHQGALLNQYPAVLDDGNTVAWYDYTASDTITKNESNKVSRWNDRLGSGHDLIQATEAFMPTLTDTGVLLDGIAQRMATEAFTLNQPTHIYAVLKPITWTVSDVFYDGIADNTGRLRQRNITPGIKASSGNESGENVDLIIGEYGIVKVLFNNPAGLLQSRLDVNNGTPTIFSGGAANMGGFTLAGATSSRANFEVKEIIIRKVKDSEIHEAEIYSYLYNKYWKVEMLTDSEDGGVFF